MKFLIFSLLTLISLSLGFNPLITFFATGHAGVPQRDDVREVFVEANHAKLFCRVFGKGDPIVVLHGGPGLSHEYLLPQMAKLSENNLVIFYDQRLHGNSTGEATSQAIQVDVFLDDLECIRKTFGFKKIAVLGHSWGGFLAMQYAIAHPEAVDKLILVNTMGPSSDEFALFVKEWMHRMAPYQKDLKAITGSQKFIEGDPATIERYYQILFRKYCYNPEKADLLNIRMTQKAIVNGSKAYEIFRQSIFTKSFNFCDRLKKLYVPTLIIHGDSDPVPPVTAQNIHQNIPNSRYILLKDCGHFPYVEMPDAFFEHLHSFLHE